MIEIIVLNHLLAKNLSVGQNVSMEVPVNPPDKYIVIEKTGSGKTDYLNRASFAVQSIAKTSLADAAELNVEVIAAMETLNEHPAVYASNLNSDYNYTNTETKEYRYQAVFDIYYQEGE